MSSKTQFEEVVLNNYHWFMRYVISIIKDQHAAEDIVQEVFIRAYKNYDAYEENGKLRRWLSIIV